MSRINEAFKKGKQFIPFITAGDPNLEVTEELIVRMAEEGAGLIEIGIPFSDPVAEGVVIQRADERALSAGTTTDKIFNMVKRIRAKTEAALVFMTYVNPIYTYGVEKFMNNCRECGIDGVIVPDLPFEEKDELAPLCRQYGVELIPLIAPTSHDRVRMIAREAEGFVYCVSSMGVTGVREQFSGGLPDMVKLVKEEKDIPCAIGFGISRPEHVKQMFEFADGAIVGSAIVKIIEQYGEQCVEPVCEYVRKMIIK